MFSRNYIQFIAGGRLIMYGMKNRGSRIDHCETPYLQIQISAQNSEYTQYNLFKYFTETT